MKKLILIAISGILLAGCTLTDLKREWWIFKKAIGDEPLDEVTNNVPDEIIIRDVPDAPATFSDEIDITTISKWLHTDVSSWPVTHRLDVRFTPSTIILEQAGTSVWPPTTIPRGGGGTLPNGTGNAWVIVKVNGKWVAATFEWFRKGQKSKPKKTVKGDHIKQAPLANFTPTSGTEYGFMVSGLARGRERNAKERTNIVLMRWP